MATFHGWHEKLDARTGSDIDSKPYPPRPVSQSCCFTLALASLFLLAAALWQHVAAAASASMLESTSQGYLKGGVGASAVAIVWIPFASVTIAFGCIAIMIVAIHAPDVLFDD